MAQPLWKTVQRFLRKINRANIWFNNPTLGTYPKKTIIQRYVHLNVHCSTIYNSQDINLDIHTNFLNLFYLFIFLTNHEAYGILAPLRGVEFTSPALETQNLNHQTTMKVPLTCILNAYLGLLKNCCKVTSKSKF